MSALLPTRFQCQVLKLVTYAVFCSQGLDVDGRFLKMTTRTSSRRAWSRFRHFDFEPTGMGLANSMSRERLEWVILSPAKRLEQAANTARGRHYAGWAGQ